MFLKYIYCSLRNFKLLQNNMKNYPKQIVVRLKCRYCQVCCYGHTKTRIRIVFTRLGALNAAKTFFQTIDQNNTTVRLNAIFVQGLTKHPYICTKVVLLVKSW